MLSMYQLLLAICVYRIIKAKDRSNPTSLTLHNYLKFTTGLGELQAVEAMCFMGEEEVVRGAGLGGGGG